MYVINRSKNQEAVKFDRITDRNRELLNRGTKPLAVLVDAITIEVIKKFINGISTRELDALTSSICLGEMSKHGDYATLAARILASDMHKRTSPDMYGAMLKLVESVPEGNLTRFSQNLIDFVKKHNDEINAVVNHDNDFNFSHFGLTTLIRGYCMRSRSRTEENPFRDTDPIERIQHLYMRVALGVFMHACKDACECKDTRSDKECLQSAFEFYKALSSFKVSNATPTLLNSGTILPQMSSCFQIPTGDSMNALADTLKDTIMAGKMSGGVSIWLHSVRAKTAHINTSGGESSGIAKYIKVLDTTQGWVNQGGNRPGAFAVYLQPDHDDIYEFLKIARLKSDEATRGESAPNLKYALWVPDLFWEILIAEIGGTGSGDWHLFSPDKAPGLHLVYGEEYRALRERYISEGRYRRIVKASDIIREAFLTWSQTGVPYVLNKDHINKKSNFKNVAPICSSNLCCEITIPSWCEEDSHEFAKFNPGNTHAEIGVCNLATICLASHLKTDGIIVMPDYDSIAAATRLEVRALNAIIDRNHPSTEAGARSNRRHRPIGIGMMGLANVCAAMKIPWYSKEALAIARKIAAVMYYNAVSESCELAKKHGPYATFAGSPMSFGILQPDMWVAEGHLSHWEEEVADVVTQQQWKDLRADVRICGVRNSQLIALPPTATTGVIVGQNESIEPFMSNVFTRKTLVGEATMVNQHLIDALSEIGLWNDDMRKSIIAAGGSIQDIATIPENIRGLFKTAREMHPCTIVKMNKAVAPFVCQSMSMNIFVKEPNLPLLLRVLTDAWKEGLKTGMYYYHTAPASGVIVEKNVVATPMTTPVTACSSCVL